MTAKTVMVQRTVIILATLAWLAQKTANHAILTLLTQSNNVKHVMLGLFLILKCRIASFNATTLLSLIGMLAFAVYAL